MNHERLAKVLRLDWDSSSNPIIDVMALSILKQELTHDSELIPVVLKCAREGRTIIETYEIVGKKGTKYLREG